MESWNLYDDQGDHQKALPDLNEAIRLHPGDPKLINDRGCNYTAMGNYDKGLVDFNAAVRLDPKDPTIFYNRANLYGRKGDYENLIADDNRALSLTARTPAEGESKISAFHNRTVGYYHKGDYKRAIADSKEETRRDPKNWRPCNGLGWYLATCPHNNLRDGIKAVEYATKACELSHWKNPTTIDTLAAAEAERGDFKAAIKWEEKYLQTANLTEKDVSEAKSRLALYQSGKPYHEEKPDPIFRITP